MDRLIQDHHENSNGRRQEKTGEEFQITKSASFRTQRFTPAGA
jgi:hypothetical protein